MFLPTAEAASLHCAFPFFFFFFLLACLLLPPVACLLSVSLAALHWHLEFLFLSFFFFFPPRQTFHHQEWLLVLYTEAIWSDCFSCRQMRAPFSCHPVFYAPIGVSHQRRVMEIPNSNLICRNVFFSHSTEVFFDLCKKINVHNKFLNKLWSSEHPCSNLAHSNNNKPDKGTKIFLALIYETNNISLIILLKINMQSCALPGQLLIL